MNFIEESALHFMYTECDASYMIIAVPNQSREPKSTGGNIVKFEFNVNDDCTIFIPMDIGSVFTYSGYLRTH